MGVGDSPGDSYMGCFSVLKPDVQLHCRNGKLPAHCCILAARCKVLAAHPRFVEEYTPHAEFDLTTPFVSYAMEDVAAVLQLLYQPEFQPEEEMPVIAKLTCLHADTEGQQQERVTAIRDRVSLLHVLDAESSASHFVRLFLTHVYLSYKQSKHTDALLHIAIIAATHHIDDVRSRAFEDWWGSANIYGGLNEQNQPLYSVELLPKLPRALAQDMPHDMLLDVFTRALAWQSSGQIKWRCAQCRAEYDSARSCCCNTRYGQCCLQVLVNHDSARRLIAAVTLVASKSDSLHEQLWALLNPSS